MAMSLVSYCGHKSGYEASYPLAVSSMFPERRLTNRNSSSKPPWVSLLLRLMPTSALTISL